VPALHRRGRSPNGGGRFSGAIASIVKAAGFAEQLARTPSHSAKYRERFGRLQEKLGDLYTVCGNTDEAVIAYRARSKCQAAIPRLRPSFRKRAREPGLRLPFEAGQAAFLRRAWARGRNRFFRRAQESEELYQGGTGRPLAVAALRLPLPSRRHPFRHGPLRRSQATYERDLALTQESLSTHPENPRLQRGLSMSLGNLGEALLALGDFAGARGAFDQSQGISLQLCATALTNPQYLRDLLIARTRQANLAIAGGRPDARRAKSSRPSASRIASARWNPRTRRGKRSADAARRFIPPEPAAPIRAAILKHFGNETAEESGGFLRL